LVSQTFEKFGLKNLKSNDVGFDKDFDELEKEKRNPITKLLKMLPEYAFLIDHNICFPDDFFG